MIDLEKNQIKTRARIVLVIAAIGAYCYFVLADIDRLVYIGIINQVLLLVAYVFIPTATSAFILFFRSPNLLSIFSRILCAGAIFIFACGAATNLPHSISSADFFQATFVLALFSAPIILIFSILIGDLRTSFGRLTFSLVIGVLIGTPFWLIFEVHSKNFVHFIGYLASVITITAMFFFALQFFSLRWQNITQPGKKWPRIRRLLYYVGVTPFIVIPLAMIARLALFGYLNSHSYQEVEDIYKALEIIDFLILLSPFSLFVDINVRAQRLFFALGLPMFVAYAFVGYLSCSHCTRATDEIIGQVSILIFLCTLAWIIGYYLLAWISRARSVSSKDAQAVAK